MPVIGFLNTASAQAFVPLVDSFRKGLNEAGLIEGRNVAIEYRWAENHHDRLPALAADLVRHKVAVICTTGGEAAAVAAMKATSSIPIIFIVAEDPVTTGLVASFNRPGGNATGATLFANSVASKRWEMLRELVPGANSMAVLARIEGPSSQLDLQRLHDALGKQPGDFPRIVNAASEQEIEPVFADLASKQVGALFLTAEALFTTQRQQIVELAARYRIPTSYAFREFPEIGGLMSYGPSLAAIYREVGAYAARILRGARPADLPVVQPTTIELVINMKTARALGLQVPDKLTTLADELLE